MSRYQPAQQMLMVTLGITLILVIGLLVILSPQPLATISLLFIGPWKSTYALGSLLASASTGILGGIGIALAFQAGLFNLGGEGQIYSGATVATIVALYVPAMPGFLGKVVLLAVGGLTGGCIAGISGFLKVRYRIHELISSFLLSGAVVYACDAVITDILRDASGFLLATPFISSSYYLRPILVPSPLTLAFPLAIVLAVGASLWVKLSPGGYELRMAGLNPTFTAYGGISLRRMTIKLMALSGGFFGLAGALLVLGEQHRAIVGFTSGYGWNGITVALIALLDPIAAIPAAIFLSWLNSGIQAAMAGTSLSYELGTIVQGTVLFLITLQFSRRRTS